MCVCVCVCVFTIQLIVYVCVHVWFFWGGCYPSVCVYIIPLICVYVFVFYYSSVCVCVCVCVYCMCVCLAHPSAVQLDLLWYMSKACVSVYPNDRLRESKKKIFENILPFFSPVVIAT